MLGWRRQRREIAAIDRVDMQSRLDGRLPNCDVASTRRPGNVSSIGRGECEAPCELESLCIVDTDRVLAGVSLEKGEEACIDRTQCPASRRAVFRVLDDRRLTIDERVDCQT